MGAGADGLATWVASCLLLSLRIAPTLLFAPPFTLVRVPRLVLALMGLALSAMLVAAIPGAMLVRVDPAVLALGAVRELMIGLVPVVALQGLFGALYMAGRTIDIQSGYGLALLIDPTTRAQSPLVGTLFAYAAGVTFFAMNGHFEVLRFFAMSLEAMPLGTARLGVTVPALGAYLGTVATMALGIGAAAILALFVTDLAVAMLSRTVPQLNALILGIQVKALLLPMILPIAFGGSAALFMQLVSTAIAAMPRLV